jgi:hypothetical protein
MSYIEYVNAGEPVEDLLPVLAKANEFTMEELAENRAGRISNQQMVKVARKALKPFETSAKALIGWLLFLLVIRTFVPSFVLKLASLFLGKSLGGMFLLITIGCIVSVVIGLLKSTRLTFLLVRDLIQGKTAKAEGRVSASSEEEKGIGMDRLHGDNVATYYYVLKNEYYEVTPQGHEALEEGSLYTIYFAPLSKLLLSIEPQRGKTEPEVTQAAPAAESATPDPAAQPTGA